MSENELKCSLSECRARQKEVDTMSFDDLQNYADKCSTCGNWVLKDNIIAQETYQKVSLKWAEEFNKITMIR